MAIKARKKDSAPKETAANIEDAEVEARTVFVRNLPYTFSDSQLQEVFSEVGPVRRSFTIKEKGSEQCRGFGYVQFALKEDAARAVELKDGTDLHGRKVMVKPAKRRASFDERRTKKTPNDKTIKEEAESSGSSVKNPSTSEKLEEKEHVDAMPKKKEDTGLNNERKRNDQHGTVDPKEAAFQEERIPSLKGEKHKANNVKLFDNEGGVKAQQKGKRQLGARDIGEHKKKKKKVEMPSRDSRSSEKQKVARTVILGGLITADMREAVLELAKKVGSIESVQSSLSPEELKGRGLEKGGCKVGAAAVVFTSVRAAAQAVAELHRKPVGDGIVWARQLGGEGSKPRKWRVIIRNLPFNVTEEKLKELLAPTAFVWEAKVPRKEGGQAKGYAFASFTSKADAEKAIRVMNGKVVQKRPIAVDWVVEKSVYKPGTDVGAKSEEHAEALPSDIEDEETASEDEDDELSENLDFELGDGVEVESFGSFDEIGLAKKVLNQLVSSSLRKEAEGDLLEAMDIEVNKADEGPDEGGGLSETTARDVEQAARSKSRDDLFKTVFIKNLPFDLDANALKKYFSTFGKVKSTFLVQHPVTKRPKGTAFVEFQAIEGAEAALAAAAGASNDMKFANGIMVGGRKLEVLKAVEKKSAEAIEKEKLEHVVVDRRNLFLTKEGKIEEGTPAANGVSEEDMSKRRQLEQVKATKLKSPNFHVSRTRLAVYNVPISMNEVELRKLFIGAVKSRATKQNPTIKQVKILKDEAKGDTSRGIAFVEFTEHQHALVAVRVLNNNPETFGPQRRPIVEFAIENLQTQRKRQERQLDAGRNKADNASTEGKKQPKKRDKKSKKSKDEAIGDGRQGSIDEKKKLIPMGAKGHHLPAPNVQKSSSGLTHIKGENLPGKKRKRDMQRDMNISDDRGLDRIHERPPSKRKNLGKISSDGDLATTRGKLSSKNMWKLPNGSARRERVNRDLSQNKGWPRIKQHTNGELAHHEKAYKVPQKAPKAADRRKKGLKFEGEDKLEKLVAVYREKYFSNFSGGAKEKRKSSNDLKRWFE